MNPPYLLDTNTCVEILRNRSQKVVSSFQSRPPDEILLCSVVVAELYFGAYKKPQRPSNVTLLQAFLPLFLSLPFDDRAADVYGDIRADLETKGTPIGPNDFMIAAIALANDVTLVTHNTREFSRVSGLKIVDWH